MPSSHNWNELHTVLLALGYRQEITQDERLIYVNGEDRVVLQKLNNFDLAFVLVFCQHVGIKYMDFLKIYQREYERQNRKKDKSS